MASCPTTWCSRWQDHRLDYRQGPAHVKGWLCYLPQSNHQEWQHTELITLWLQLVNQNIMDTSRTNWQLRTPTNYHDHQPQSSIKFNPYLMIQQRFSYLQPHFTKARPNQVRNWSLGSALTSKQRSATETTYAVILNKTNRNGMMLVKKRT